MQWKHLLTILFIQNIGLSLYAQEKSILNQKIDSILSVDLPKFEKYEKLRRYGVSKKNQGKFSEALVVLNQASENFLELDSLKSYARCLNNIGTVYYWLGIHHQAYDYLYQSEKINDSIKYTLGLFLNYINLGNFNLYQHHYPEANRFYLQALDMARVLNDTSRLALMNQNLGALYSKDDDNIENTFLDSDRALQHFQKALSYYKSIGDSTGIYACYRNFGYLEEIKGRFQNALNYYNLVLSYSRRHSVSRLEIESLNNVGNVYLAQSRDYDALNTYSKALEKAKKAGFKDQIKYLNKNIAKCHVQIGNANLVYYHNEIYDLYKDSIYNSNNSRQVAELNARYETEKKQQQIELQEATILIQTAENRTLMTTLIVAVGFTFLTLIIFQQRQKALKELGEKRADLRIKEQELHEQQVDQLVRDQELKSINSMLEGEEKERKRIAEDLHDRVGSMLSALKLQTDSSDSKMTALLDETVEEVRRISHNLETKVLNRFGLVAALADLAQKIKSAEKVDFELQHLDLNERLDNKIEINAYRIVQELVSNALKHSQATEIVTQVNRIDQQLVITVEDNGIGFDSLNVKENSTGMGLKNIMSRVNDLNGNFNVDSGKGNGTTVTVDFPI